MFSPDTHTRTLLVRERQAELRRDSLAASIVRPEADASVRPRRRLRLPPLRVRLHPAPGTW